MACDWGGKDQCPGELRPEGYFGERKRHDGFAGGGYRLSQQPARLICSASPEFTCRQERLPAAPADGLIGQWAALSVTIGTFGVQLDGGILRSVSIASGTVGSEPLETKRRTGVSAGEAKRPGCSRKWRVADTLSVSPSGGAGWSVKVGAEAR